MELRVLRYFLAVAREQSISAAAAALHLSQPTLSTQLKAMEDELGKQLFIRRGKGARRIMLTEEGMLLRKRAEEILALVQKTEMEIQVSGSAIIGNVYIGAGETDIVRLFARAAKAIQKQFPDIHYHISSGNAEHVLESLDKGLIDFGLLYGPLDRSKYEAIALPVADTFGVLMRRDAPIAEKACITPEDLWDKPLIVSQQEERDGWPIAAWMGKDLAKLNIVATYNLIFNGSLMVDEGLGYAICFDKLINTAGSTLCFRPLDPPLYATAHIVWKKYQVFSKASAKFLEQLTSMDHLAPGEKPEK